MANQINFNLQAPKPPSSKESSEDPTRTLLWIQDRIYEIYTIKRPEQQHNNPATSTLNSDRAAYLDIYNSVNSYIVPKRNAQSSPAAHREATLLGEDLYRSLERAVRIHCQESGMYINAHPKALTAYMERWTTLLDISLRVGRLFRYLERQWIQRVMDEKRKGIYCLHDLHLMTWREEILTVESGKFIDALARLQQHGDSGIGSDDKKLREDCTASLSAVGLTLSGGSLVALES